jgi:hypothetical protein
MRKERRMEHSLCDMVSFYAIQGKKGDWKANKLYYKKQKCPSFSLINITT